MNWIDRFLTQRLAKLYADAKIVAPEVGTIWVERNPEWLPARRVRVEQVNTSGTRLFCAGRIDNYEPVEAGYIDCKIQQPSQCLFVSEFLRDYKPAPVPVPGPTKSPPSSPRVIF